MSRPRKRATNIPAIKAHNFPIALPIKAHIESIISGLCLTVRYMCPMLLMIGILSVFIHLLVIFLVLAGGDVVKPCLVVEIPFHGFFNAFLKL